MVESPALASPKPDRHHPNETDTEQTRGRWFGNSASRVAGPEVTQPRAEFEGEELIQWERREPFGRREGVKRRLIEGEYRVR